MCLITIALRQSSESTWLQQPDRQYQPIIEQRKWPKITKLVAVKGLEPPGLRSGVWEFANARLDLLNGLSQAAATLVGATSIPVESTVQLSQE